MSDLPRFETDTTSPLSLRIAAVMLSGVVGAFVSYWISYGLHALFDLFAMQFSHTDVSWALSIVIGIAVGLCSAYWVYIELSQFVEV